jgi:RNA polymerase sigma-70 factor (ECF subfamily)
MPAGQLERTLRHLRNVARQHEDGPVKDAKLLERFIAHRDEEAFELLVRRHGPMVLGVCKRVLGNATDAEDAFQATFLVLVRKATSIRPRSRVGNWLHGVAHKTALKANAMNRTRRAKEREAGEARGGKGADDTREPLLEVLDAELNALPEIYQAPIVLCDLEGLSYREAAGRLGCPPGTLSGRLTRARALLARRLALRGASVSTAVLPGLLAREVLVGVPPSLLDQTVRASLVVAGGKAFTEAVVSAKVVSLSEGVLKMLLLSRLKVVTAGFLLLVAVVAAGWTCAGNVPGDQVPPGATAGPRAPASKGRATIRPGEPREAEFVVRRTARERNTVSLVVAGTSAPVLCLAVKKDLRVLLLGGKQVGIEGLRPGTRVAIRLDATNSVIQDIRAVGDPNRIPVLKRTSDLAQLDLPPDEAEILRALPRVPRAVPGVLEVFRDDISVVSERLVKRVDPPRVFPLVGEAKLHHQEWKCTVYYDEIVEYRYPHPARIKRARVNVVYIDKDYLVLTR